MARTFGEMGIREIQTGLAAKEFSAAEVARGTFEHRRGRRGGACLPGNHRGTRARRGGSHRRRRRRGAPRRDGPARGRSRGLQGQPEPHGHAHDVLLEHAARLRVPLHGDLRGKDAARRRSSHRQAEHGRVRLRRLHRDLRLRPHLQPVGCRARARRQLGRKRRGRGGGLCAGVARVGYGRLHPPAGLVLRSGGREAHLRRGVALRRGGLRQLARPGGPLRPFGGGRGARAERAFRPRRAGLHEPAVRRGLHGQPR